MSQTQQLRKYLERHQRIDPMTALHKLGIYRLGARIYDLREAGVSIETNRKHVKTRSGYKARVAEYVLA